MSPLFKKIGAAWKNKNHITIKFDENLFERVHKEDILKKISMFPNKFKKEKKHPDYYLAAPVKDE